MEAESFVSVVTSLATVVGRDFIFFFIAHFICQSEALFVAPDQQMLLFILWKFIS